MQSSTKSPTDLVATMIASKANQPSSESASTAAAGVATMPVIDLTATPSTSTGSTKTIRRSDRERQSTLVYLHNQPVLKTNNYVVKGMSYHYSDEGGDKVMAKKNKGTVANNNNDDDDEVVFVKVVQKKPRIQTLQEIERQLHNARVQQSKASKQVLRKAFLKQNVETLKPFLEDKVYEQIVLDEDLDSSDTIKAVKDVVMTDSRMIEQPNLVTGGKLRDYQLEGLQFLIGHHRRNLGAILGDEMGLGKTVQTISLLCYLKEQEHKHGPSLVICPLSVLSSWMKELEFWAPTLKVQRLHSASMAGQERDRKTLMDDAESFDVVLTTYEMVKAAHLKTFFQRLHFHYMVLDEGHKVKGHETLIAGAVRKIHRENTLLLTGTPLQNNLVELWSLLQLMYPEVFTTLTPFEKSFNLSQNHVDSNMLLRAQKLLDLFMIRRLKSRVEKLLPPKLETRVYCPLSKEQVFLYKTLLMKDFATLEKVEKTVRLNDDDNDDEDEEEEGGVSQTMRQRLTNLFMNLRKASQHPYLFDGMEGSNASIVDMVAASGKLAVLDKLLCSLCQKGHRSVLFSQFTMVLDVLEDYCNMRGWKYARFDGRTSRAKRTYLVNQFNADNSPFFLFLMSTKSGGIGLNLQSADTCILFDSDWNPQNDLQAMARVHRIGQKKKVHVYRLITANTVEERIVERAAKKLLLDQAVNRENDASLKSSSEDSGLGMKNMLKDIKFGANAIFGGHTIQELPSDEDIDQITNRNRKETDTLGKLKGGTEENGADFDAEKEFTASQTFGGIDYRQIREEHERKLKMEIPKSLKGIGHLWQSIKEIDGKKRTKKSRLVMVEGNGTGYGKALVPVLASNNYELEAGESSVFGRELKASQKKKAAVPSKKKRSFVHSSYCQICLDGGRIVLCPLCPCSMHLECCGLKRAKDFSKCWHHRCTKCNKSGSDAGGMLYPCAICPESFCEDCLPVNEKGFRYLGRSDRWEELGYDSEKLGVYIHCSAECEKWAEKEFNWKPEKLVQVCPEKLDVSFNFGVCNNVIGVAEREDTKKLDVGDLMTTPGKLPSTVVKVPSLLALSGSSVTSTDWNSNSSTSQSFKKAETMEALSSDEETPLRNDSREVASAF